jgi:hypothetical protein
MSDQVVKLITDALQKSPDTGADAVAMYKTLSTALAKHLIDSLPTLEEKVVALEKIIMKDVVETVETSGCCKVRKIK